MVIVLNVLNVHEQENRSGQLKKARHLKDHP